jgi:hypothetical protein
MNTLILPVAGRSSRYGLSRPKWLLTMPSGELMFEFSISKLDFQHFTKIIFICLEEHLKFISEEKIKILLKEYCKNIEIVILSEPTKSQSETVFKALEFCNVSGPFFVKDCDNQFSFSFSGESQIATLLLSDETGTNATNKSYVDVDSFNNVKNIVEKRVISNQFCCGGYGFDSSQKFMDAFKDIEERNNGPDEIYLSHVIYELLLRGNQFKASMASSFIDLGTSKEYRLFCKKHLTIFCDIDGVLCKNGSKFGDRGWKTPIIEKNVKALVDFQKIYNLYIVVTTSRPWEEKEDLQNKLDNAGLKVEQYVMSLPHGRRVLINDFASTNSYPSAISVNLERDNDNLNVFLKGLFGE